MVLDEGLATPSAEKYVELYCDYHPMACRYTLFYGERATNWVTFRLKGNTGHGSRFIDNTAVEKLVPHISVMAGCSDIISFFPYQVTILSRIYAVRTEQRKILDDSSCGPAAAAKTLGDVLTVNVTALQAGVASSR